MFTFFVQLFLFLVTGSYFFGYDVISNGAGYDYIYNHIGSLQPFFTWVSNIFNNTGSNTLILSQTTFGYIDALGEFVERIQIPTYIYFIACCLSVIVLITIFFMILKMFKFVFEIFFTPLKAMRM